jgi:type I restriction enzyme, S subunit
MKFKTLPDYCEIKTGKLDANAAVENGAYPFFTCAQYPEWIDKFDYDDDVVLLAGNNAHANFHVSRFKGKFNAYQRTYILSAKPQHDINFVYYYLKLVMKILKEHSQGSQTKFLTMPILSSIQFPDLDENTQSRIVSILQIIDKKIEVNNTTCTTLENLYEAIFDYWFVQFDFPDENGHPFQSSGGEMVFKDEIKQKIPKNWKVGNLDELGEIAGGATPSKSIESNFCADGHSWITPNDLSEAKSRIFVSKGALDITEEGATSANLKFLPKGSVLLSSRAPVGYMAITTKEVATNQGFKSFIPNKGYSTEFVFLTVKRSIPVIVNYSTGSTFKEISGDTLKSVPVILPPMSLVSSFTNIVVEMFSMREVLEEENEMLKILRDWLLPMLLNGQVTVQDGG